jgi:hypothetical protein
MLPRFGILLLAAMSFALSLGLSERLITGPPGHGLVSTAQAVVGRPLTPVSVAGVARRTVRRCAVGVYNC